MDGVAELVANNGVFAADEEKPPKSRRSMIKRGALLGATLMFIGAPVILTNDGQEMLVVFFFYWVALMALIGASGYLKRLTTNIFNIFSEEEPSPPKKIGSPRGPALSSAYSAPGADSGKQIVDTSKMGQPSSIVEQTTRALEEARKQN
jgi:hypothetical protein